MAPTLYLTYSSPAVRAVLMTAKALGLTLEEKEINLLAKEQFEPEFLKINPQHTVPTLVDDDGFVIWDSHAIIAYLVSRYGKDDSLYPKDLKKRALVDQRLHFEGGVVFATFLDIVVAILKTGKSTIVEQDREDIDKVYGFLEAFLGGNKFVAGNAVTVADFSLISSISSLNVFAKISEGKYPRIIKWITDVEALPAYEGNVKGLDLFTTAIKNRLKE